NWVLDADIRDFFGTIDHGWMVKFVEHRVADRRVLRLIRKWLSAGVSEDGIWSKTEVGTPQGAVITPRTPKVTSRLNVGSLGGVSSQCLICVVSSTMFMSSGASDEGAQSPPDERRLSPSGSADRGCGRSTAARTRVCVVATPGLSLPRTSCRTERS